MAFLEVSPDSIRELIYSKTAERVTSMEGVRNHVGESRETKVLFRQLRLEFHLVKCGFKVSLIDSVFSYFIQNFLNSFLSLLHLLELYALHSKCEGALPRGVVISIPRAETGSNSRLYNALVERSIWSFKEEVL